MDEFVKRVYGLYAEKLYDETLFVYAEFLKNSVSVIREAEPSEMAVAETFTSDSFTAVKFFTFTTIPGNTPFDQLYANGKTYQRTVRFAFVEPTSRSDLFNVALTKVTEEALMTEAWYP